VAHLVPDKLQLHEVFGSAVVYIRGLVQGLNLKHSKLAFLLIYLRGLGEPPQKAQGQRPSNVKVECIQDLHFHVSNLLLSVGVVSDIHAVTNGGAHYLLVFGRNQQTGDSDQLELRLRGRQSNLKLAQCPLNAETKILTRG
jgi:hypothetical protein